MSTPPINYFIKETLVSFDDVECKDKYIFESNEIKLHEFMVLLYRILDGKHDFGGGGQSDRSYMNEDDCNNTILATQITKATNQITKATNAEITTSTLFK